MPTPRIDLAVGVVNGILYAIGGSNSTTPWLATVEAYVAVGDSWTTKAPMPTPRLDLAAGGGALIPVLYAVGGSNSTTAWLSTVEVYDPATNSWTTKDSLPAPRTDLIVGVIPGAAGFVNDVLVAVGGANSTAPWLPTAEGYHP